MLAEANFFFTKYSKIIFFLILEQGFCCVTPCTTNLSLVNHIVLIETGFFVLLPAFCSSTKSYNKILVFQCFTTLYTYLVGFFYTT